MSLNEQNYLGEKIRQARVLAKISQIGLAEIIGIGKNSMIDTEKGRRSVSTTELKKIAEATNQSLKFFLEEEPKISDGQRSYSTDKEYRYVGDLDNGDITVVDKVIEALRAKKNPDK